MLSKIKNIFKKQEHQTDFSIPITQYEEQDVFIVGYPKSGNTWMTHIMTGISIGSNMERVSNRLVREVVPDIHTRPTYTRYTGRMFFKSHDLPKKEFRNVIYIVRDGRDAVLSYYHMLQNTGNDISWKELIEDGKGLFPSKWHTHVKQWKENPYGANMLALRYEDLKNDGFNSLKKICEFLKMDLSDEILNQILGNTSFKKMKAKEQSGYWDKKSSWKEGKSFIRKGEVGGYKKEIPADLLAKFEQESRAELSLFGYE